MLEFNMVTLCKLVLEMFVFSCAGWVMEVTLKYIQYHRFINRGFLIGPYCPIYGSGVVAVTVFVGGIIGYEGSYVETFFAGFLVCGILEYFVSWYMEKMFHARWWDYSTKPMNLNGRIWIGNLILFGLGSVVIIKWIDPVFFQMVSTWPEGWIIALAVAIVVLLISDNIVSHFLMNMVKKEIDGSQADNTEEISNQVRLLLRDKKLLLRRIESAYPNLQARPKYLTEQLKAARHEAKALAKKTKQELHAMSNYAKQELSQAKAEVEKVEESAKQELRTELRKRLAANAAEREANAEKTRMELNAAKEKLRAIQEKLTYHRE